MDTQCSTDVGSFYIRYESISSIASISPVLLFRLETRAYKGQSRLRDIKAELTLNNFRIGTLTPEIPYLDLHSNYSSSLNLYLELDHYKLHKIEQFRKGGDLKLILNARLILENLEKPGQAIGNLSNLNVDIPKSEWVEKILPNIGFKDVSLIELPKIIQQWQKIIEHTNEAWHQHSMGKYDKVLIECRKALEALGEEVKSKGFVKTKNESDEEKQVLDWKGLFKSENLGDILGTINKKFNGFLAPAAHTGKAINKEDADFALLVTHGIITLVTENLMKLPEP